jgi:cytochrome P450
MTSAAATELAFPHRKRPPAPLPQQRKLGPLGVYRMLRSNSIAVWADEVYMEPVVVDRSLLGDILVVNAPDAIRRVFLDNAANYPKDDLQIEKLGPALGRSLLTAGGAEWRFQRRTVAPLFHP